MSKITVELDFPEGIIRYPLEHDGGPELLWKIARNLLPLCDRLTEKGSAIAESFDKTVSCKMGCGVCCCQMVPLSPPEAAIIADVVEHLPQERRQQVKALVAAALEQLSAAGIRDDISDIYSIATDKHEVLELNRKYFELSIPCPFLVDGFCSIYPHRPSRCREYSVLSPSEWCADPFDPRIRRLPLTIRFCESLSYAWASITKNPPVIIPLVKALEWVDEHPEISTLQVDKAEKVATTVLEFACKKANVRAQKRMQQ